MKKKWNVIATALLAVLLVLPLAPKAAAAERQTVDPAKDTGSISLTLQTKNGTGRADNVNVTIYRVGTGVIENNNLVFELADSLKPTDPEEVPVELNGLKAEQNIENAASLKTKIGALQKALAKDETLAEKYHIENQTQKTGKDGVVTFEEVPVGVYLVVQTSRHEDYYNITPFLLYLPFTDTDENGHGIAWEYDVEAGPKVSARPSGGGEEPTPPGQEILDPDVPTDPGMVPEEPGEEIPDPDVPLAQLPQTGMLQWPVPVLALVGILLFSTGWMMDQKGRKAREV